MKVITDAIDQVQTELKAISLEIHDNPELAFKEYKAAELQCKFLEKHGFTVEKGVAGLSTAYRAERVFGDGPKIAFLAEYDALPEIGHACGHNLIAIMALAAGVGLAAASGRFNGTVIVLGTPGEEEAGGKINMVQSGLFNDLDCALMIHPSGGNVINRGSTALRHYIISFKGKNAHSSAPENGVNALTAVIQTFNNIDYLRPVMPMSANVNGIITAGGTAANVITDYAACEFTARASTLGELSVVCNCIERAVKAAETLVGAEAKIDKLPVYAEMHPNILINERYKTYADDMDLPCKRAVPGGKHGSSDIGNVSLVVPSMHAYVDIKPEASSHTAGFAVTTGGDYAHEVCFKAAKAMAMTGFDIMTDGAFLRSIKEEFDTDVPKYGPEVFN